MKVSLVIPAYNEEARLAPFLDSVVAFKQRHPNAFDEVLVVDDGSRDKTAEAVKKYKQRFPYFKLLTHAINQGKGAAVRTGVLAARGDYIVFMDADGATPISEFPKMLQALHETPVAVGNRWMKGAKTQRHSLLRRFSGWANRQYMRLFGLGQIDTMCGFKGYRAPLARELFSTLQDKRWLFDTEIAYKVVRKKIPVTNFPIRWESKEGSKLSTVSLILAGLQIWPLVRRINTE